MADHSTPAQVAMYTPGPWSVRNTERQKYGVCRHDHPDTSADVHGRDGQFVADCGCHEQANANARLIASAPALLKALERLLNAVGSSPGALETADAVIGARAAIALAKGSASLVEGR